MIRTLEQLFLLFIIYSFFGWLWESAVCSLWNQGRLINRGFLNGPYCPIYGAGALLGLLILGQLKNPVILFFLSAVLTCSLEYLTSWAMEKLFRARWWDYSDKPLNINGRVYIGGFLAFGFASVMLIRHINPFIEGRMEKMPPAALHVLCGFLAVAVITDAAVTVTGFNGFNERLRELASALESAKEGVMDNLAEVRESVSGMIHESRPFEALGSVKEAVSGVKDTVYDKLRSYRDEAYDRFLGRLTRQQRRILRAFPRFRSTSYGHIMPGLRRFIAARRKK